MAITNFIPTLWSARLLQNIHTMLIYGQAPVVNRDYEGQISQVGDTVKITNIGAVTVGDYTKNGTIGEPQELTDAQRTLQITQSKYFHFFLDDVDKAQALPGVMDQAMSEAAYALASVADKFISNMYLDAQAANLIGSDGTPVIPTKADAYEYLVDLSTKLDEADVPPIGRWVVIPPWYEGMLLKDSRFVANGTASGVATLMNGQIGAAAGFNILKSNNVPNTTATKYKITAGVSQAYSFAEQIHNVEAYRPEKRFADAMKGLHLYGGKTIRPQFLAVLTANRS